MMEWTSNNSMDMAEELNLPASLERLEIDSVRNESKVEERTAPSGAKEPECSLESLSLAALCPKETCQCNRKRESRDKDKGVKRLAQKRLILRRSKLSPAVLRAPILKLSPTSVPHLEKGKSQETPSRGRFQTKPSASVATPTYGISEYYMRAPPESRIADVQRTNCAVQARIAAESPQQSTPVADDTNIDELASYFDLFVHIPKKMSQMAEMMYI